MARRVSMADRVCIGVPVRTTDVTRRGDEASAITTEGGGTRSHGGRTITTMAGRVNIGPAVALSAGGSAIETITAACATTAAIDGRIRSGPAAFAALD